ncbi:hypothetical protein PVK06_028193 [Gossypium arboreum]|uniref:Reverse transcriptase n=1 Tax=Gossypium arboreum TaxID=29729 RepID=A0ABR0P494_GOSAR|nr:hypothetical protein PVK06_028193 [Gossypium arboreum]
MENCSLTNIGYSGQWFTWEKGRTRIHNIREHLDKGIANSPWWDLFPNFKLCHLSHAFSDHCPLLLNSNFGNQHSKQWYFKFEATWLLEESCEIEVSRIWAESLGAVPNKIKAMGVGLEEWFQKILKKVSYKERVGKVVASIE